MHAPPKSAKARQLSNKKTDADKEVIPGEEIDSEGEYMNTRSASYIGGVPESTDDEGNYIDYSCSYYSFNIIWIVTINPPKSSATTATNGIQLFTTNRMREVLEGKLGFRPNEVDELLPEVKKKKWNF